MTGYREREIETDTPLHHYGLDSLMGMRLLSLINAEFRLALQLADLADHNSIDALAALVAAAQPAAAPPAPPAPEADGGGDVGPAGWFAQRRAQSPDGLHSLTLAGDSDGRRSAFTAFPEPLKAIAGKLIRQGIALFHDSARCHFTAHAAVDIETQLNTLGAEERQALLEGLPAGVLMAPVSQEQALNLYHSEVLKQASRNIQHLYAIDPAAQPGLLDVTLLNAAMQPILARHDLLRTFYLDLDHGWAQVVAPQTAFAFRRVDLPTLADFERFIALRRNSLLDLSAAPVLQGWVSRIGDTDYLGFVTHHSLADAFTTGILFAQLMAGYHALRSDLPANPLPAIEQYWQYTLRQFDPGVYRAEATRRYWREQLRGTALAMQLPYAGDPGRIAPQRPQAAARHIISLSAEQSATAARFNREFDVTHTQLFTAAIAILLLHGLGNAVAVLQFMHTRRDRASLLHTLGEFTQMLFMPFDAATIDTEASVIGVLRAVKRKCLENLRHGKIDFSELLAMTGLGSYENYYRQSGDVILDSIDLDAGTGLGAETCGRSLFADSLLRQRPDATGNQTFATLSYQILKADQRIHLVAEYRQHLFDAADIAHLSGLIVRMVAEMMADPQQTLRGMISKMKDDFKRLKVRMKSDHAPAKHECGFLAYQDPRIMSALKALENGQLSLQEVARVMEEGGLS